MGPGAIRQLAAVLNTPIRGPRGGWFTIGCPFAATHHKNGVDRNPSMRISESAGSVSRWRCFSCDHGGEMAEILVELKALGYQLDYASLLDIMRQEQEGIEIAVLSTEDEIDPARITIPEDWLQQFKKTQISPAATIYLNKRGIGLGLQMRWDLRYDVDRQRVMFPIRDFAGNLRGAQGRALVPGDMPKYLHYAYPDFQTGVVIGSHFWYGEDKIDFDQPIVVVEGPIDAVATSGAYTNVVAAMGSSAMMQTKLDRLSAAEKIITFFDHGPAGDIARNRIRHWCSGKRLIVDVMPPPGTDPLSGKPLDPGSTPTQIIRQLLVPHIGSL